MPSRHRNGHPLPGLTAGSPSNPKRQSVVSQSSGSGRVETRLLAHAGEGLNGDSGGDKGFCTKMLYMTSAHATCTTKMVK